MPVSLSILIIIISSIALIKGTSLFINSATKLAHHFNISGYTISFFLIAVGTSLPETIIAVSAAASENPLLAFGNALGSNIALITLVIALPAILSAGISTKPILHSKDMYYAALFSLLPVLLALDGILNRFDGLILLAGYGVYAYVILERAKGIESIIDHINDTKVFKQLAVFGVALLILLGSSELIVDAAINLSTQLAIGIGFVGLTITAVGTSLPEIAFTIGAIKKNRSEDILGDIIGSVVANSTVVLGIAAVIVPINLTLTPIGAPTLFFAILLMLMFLRFARTRQKLDTLEGFILLFGYVAFVVVEFLITEGKFSYLL